MTALATKFPEKRIFTLADLPVLEAQRRSSPSQPSNGLSGRIVTFGNLSPQTQGTDIAHEALASTRDATAIMRGASAAVERVSVDLDNLKKNLQVTCDRVEREVREDGKKFAEELGRRFEQSNAVIMQRYSAIQEGLDAITHEQREIAAQMDNRSLNARCVVITALALAIFLLLAYLT